MRRDPVLVCEGLFDQPRGVQVGFPIERILKERSNVHLTVDLAIATDVVFIDKGFVSGRIVQADEVPSESVALDRAIRASDHGEFGLFSDGTRGNVSIL